MGGVEAHLADLQTGLEERGIVTQTFTSEDVEEQVGFDVNAHGALSQANTARKMIWNSKARDSLARTIKRFAPDLLHYHSIYHHLSPSVLNLYAGPTVMTLHDYKLSVPCYSLFRDGDQCFECLGKRLKWPSIRHKCVKDSTSASLLCTVEDLVHSRRYRASIDKFIVPSNWAYEVAIKSGVPSEQLAVVPWGVSRAFDQTTSARSSINTILYLGRLHVSKGIDVLLKAWRMISPSQPATLVIAGDGEMRPNVEDAARNDDSITYLGLVDREQVPYLVGSATAVVIPSMVPETMGLTGIESLMAGTPIIVSGRGALRDLVGAGAAEFDVDDVYSLVSTLNRLFNDRSYRQGMNAGLAARDLRIYETGSMSASIASLYESAAEWHA